MKKVSPYVSLRLLSLTAMAIVCFLGMAHFIDYQQATLIVWVIGIPLVLFRTLEINVKPLQMEGETTRISYLPFLTISKKIIFISLFAVVSFLLLAPQTYMPLLLPISVSMGIGEILYFLLSVKRKNYSIVFFSDHLFLQQEKEFKILAEEITLVEYRHENFYLVLSSKNSFMFNEIITNIFVTSVLS